MRASLLASFVFLLALPVAARPQDSSSQQQTPPPAQADKPARPKKDQPKKGDKPDNTFPEAQSEAAAHQQDSGAAPDAPAPKDTTPQQAAPQTKPAPSTADQNPFPEEQSQKAAHEAPQMDQSAPDSAPASPDNQEFSSSRVKGLDMPTTDETPPENLPPSPLPFDSKLAKKDANIGDYYMESGNWKGAYDRFLEANRSDPGNAEAVFGLGESAHHLHRDAEALRSFRLYLSALPNGPHAKEVHKALREMGVEH